MSFVDAASVALTGASAKDTGEPFPHDDPPRIVCHRPSIAIIMIVFYGYLSRIAADRVIGG
ncbi:hypothetical protein EYC58_04870 [Candidatus Saccharibacteria bacterium]|nr:MAG: hypothetical protein EYC58_04870 [Candidatus Saccharibacteria bacterium]